MPFCFVQCGRSPSEQSSLPEHWQSNPAQEGQTHCIWVRVTLGEGGGAQPPPPHAWTGLLIADMFQDGLEEQITDAVVLAPKRQSYFLDDDGSKRGSLLMMWGMLDSAWVAKSIGQGERIKWKWQWVLSRKVIGPLQLPLQKRESRPGGQDTPEEQQRPTRTPQKCTTSKSGCKAWRKMLLKLSWEITKQIIMGLSRRMLILSFWVEVEDGVEDNVPHNYCKTLLADLPLQEEEVQIKEASTVSINQPWLEGLEGVTMQEGQEEVWGWRSTCQSSRMKRPRMLWLTIPGGGM